MDMGFSHITDEAREQMERLGIHHKKVDTSWVVSTDPYDLYKSAFLERHAAGIEADYEPVVQPVEEYRAQGLRIWKSPESGIYYYLIEGHVFKMEQRVKVDYTAMEPTRNVVTLFDDVDEYDQDHFRDILVQLKPIAESGRMI